MSTMIALSDLVFDVSLYPRQNVDEHHVKELERAMEGGIELPPIVVRKGKNRIVDGTHRYHAALRRGLKKISATIKAYKNDTEMFKEAVLLNSGMGLKLGTDDTLRCIDIGERLGLKEIDLAAMLRTSISHLRVLKPRFATYSETKKGVASLRRIALKGSVRHLSGIKLTIAQANAMEGAPGQSYLLTVRQLLSAIESDLLPPPDKHPSLWTELNRLSEMLDRVLNRQAAA